MKQAAVAHEGKLVLRRRDQVSRYRSAACPDGKNDRKSCRQHRPTTFALVSLASHASQLSQAYLTLTSITSLILVFQVTKSQTGGRPRTHM